MTARIALMGTVAVALLAGSAAASPQRVVAILVAGKHVSLGTSSTCPDGYSSAPIVSRSGERVGTSVHCVVFVSKKEREGFAIGSISERVIQRDTIAGGTLVSRATYVFRWVDRQGSLARVLVSGRVTGGTGRYADARGTVNGRGIQRNGRLELRLVVRLR